MSRFLFWPQVAYCIYLTSPAPSSAHFRRFLVWLFALVICSFGPASFYLFAGQLGSSARVGAPLIDAADYSLSTGWLPARLTDWRSGRARLGLCLASAVIRSEGPDNISRHSYCAGFVASYCTGYSVVPPVVDSLSDMLEISPSVGRCCPTPTRY